MVIELFEREAQNVGAVPAPQPLDVSLLQEPYQGLIKMLGALQTVVQNPRQHQSENPEWHKQEIDNIVSEIKRFSDQLVAVTKKV